MVETSQHLLSASLQLQKHANALAYNLNSRPDDVILPPPRIRVDNNFSKENGFKDGGSKETNKFSNTVSLKLPSHNKTVSFSSSVNSPSLMEFSQHYSQQFPQHYSPQIRKLSSNSQNNTSYSDLFRDVENKHLIVKFEEELAKTVDTLQRDKQKQRFEIDYLRSQLRSSSVADGVIASSLKHQEAVLELRDRVRKLEDDKVELLDQIARNEQRSQSTLSDRNLLASQDHEHRIQLNNLSVERDDLFRQLTFSEEAYRYSQERERQLKERLQKYESEVDELNRTVIPKLESDKADYEVKLTSLTSELKSANLVISDLKSQRDESQQKVLLNQDVISQLELDLSTLNRRLEENRDYEQDRQKQVQLDLTRECVLRQQYEDEIKLLRATNCDNANSLSSKVHHYEERNKHMESELDELRSKLALVKRENTELICNNQELVRKEHTSQPPSTNKNQDLIVLERLKASKLEAENKASKLEAENAILLDRICELEENDKNNLLKDERRLELEMEIDGLKEALTEKQSQGITDCKPSYCNSCDCNSSYKST